MSGWKVAGNLRDTATNRSRDGASRLPYSCSPRAKWRGFKDLRFISLNIFDFANT